MTPVTPIAAAPPPRAAFGPVDASILLVALALGCAACWMDPEDLESRLGLPISGFPPIRQQMRNARATLDAPATSLGASLVRWHLRSVNLLDRFLPFITLGAAAAAFRHGRSRSRRALRRVGTLTTAVAGTFIGISLANEYVLRRFSLLQLGYSQNPFDTIWWLLGEDTSLGVVALWCILALGCHGEPRLIGRTAWAASSESPGSCAR
jgi:hypothetical protein